MTSGTRHPAKQWSKRFPLLSTLMTRLGVLSLCDGHFARQVLPNLRTPSSRFSKSSRLPIHKGA